MLMVSCFPIRLAKVLSIHAKQQLLYELVQDVTSNISRRGVKPKRAGAKVLGVRGHLWRSCCCRSSHKCFNRQGGEAGHGSMLGNRIMHLGTGKCIS